MWPLATVLSPNTATVSHPSASCQASVSWCPSWAPARVSWQSRRWCWPAREALLSPGSSGQAPGHTWERGTQNHFSGAPEHPAAHPASGDPAMGSQLCTAAERRCTALRRGGAMPRTVAG